MKKRFAKAQPFIVACIGLIFIGIGSYFKHDRIDMDATMPVMAVTSAAAPAPAPSLSVGGVRFDALIADTPEARERGLSGRASLGDGEAMVFIFDRPEVVGFWMKDMRFSIDILFLDESMRVISFVERVSPDTYPEAFYPQAPAKYVVEFTAGTIERLGAREGDLVEIRLR